MIQTTISSKVVKVTKTLAVAAFAMAAGMSTAFATTIYAHDTLIGSANLSNSGDATELTAIETATGISTLKLLTSNVDVNGSTVLKSVPGISGEYYIDLGDIGTTLLLKFGTGNSNVNNEYFFKNVADLSKLVFSNSDVNYLTGGGTCPLDGNGNDSQCNTGRLSHYALFTDTSGGSTSTGNNVPEPATVGLLGLGLLGALASRRKAAKR